MKSFNRSAAFALSLVCAVGIACAGGRGVQSRLTLDVMPGYVPHTSHFLGGGNDMGKSVDASLAAGLKYSFSFAPGSRQWQHYRGAYQGVGVGINTFFADKLLGTPFGAYVFQGAPIVRLSSRLTLGYEWNFGAFFGWEKYMKGRDETGIVGSRTNAYMNLSLLLSYCIATNWELTGGIAGSHYSNGNTTQPNGGVNTLGFRLGVTYLFGEPQPAPDNFVPELPFKPHFSYDILAYGAWRAKIVDIQEKPVILPGKFGVAGISFAPMYNFHRLFRAGLSLDLKYDESAGLADYLTPYATAEEPTFYRPPFRKSLSLGLSAKAEFVMPIFSVGVGFGRNLVGHSEVRSFYQTLTLKAYVYRGLFLNVGYQLYDFKTPSNLMLGAGITLR